MAFDHKEFDEWAKRLKNADKWTEARKAIIDGLANRIYALAVQRTPVGKYPKNSGKKGGTLKRAWAVDIKEGSDSYEVTIFNNVDYASYVEYGHRTRGGKGWIEGKFMLTKSELDVYENAEEFIRKKLEELLEEVL